MSDRFTHSSQAGPTACAADTETRLGGADIQLPSNGPMVITKVIVHPGNEVDAKASSAILELKIAGISGPFKFPVFSGQGASASQGGMLHDEVDGLNIEVPSGARVGVYITASEANAQVNAEIQWFYGGSGGRGKQTYGDILGPTDVAAAMARTRMGGATGKITMNSGGPWTVKEIRAALCNVVDDTETQGKLELVTSGITNEEYGVGSGFGAATNGTTVPCEKRKTNISVPGNAEVQIWLSMIEATVDNIVGIVYQ